MAKRKIDETELKALLSDEIRSSIVYDSSELSEKRARALEYYRGEMKDTQAAPNRSSVVSRDVADTIGWMLPGIIRVFTASDRMAEYEPVGRGDEQFAQQATDYCNHIFWKDNPGYRILWNSTHDSLLQGNGIVKHWWDDKEVCEYSEHSGMSAEQLALLQQEQGVEIVAQEPGEPQQTMVMGPEGPMQQDVETFNVKVKRVTMNGKVRIDCIEPERFLMNREAITIEEARFVAHLDEVTRSDLIEMGFDRETVEKLPSDHHSAFLEETLSRDDEYDRIGKTGHDSMRLIELYECYIKLDVDGDGKAETVRAYVAGASGANELLDWEVWDDDVPFSDIPCEPVPHRWDARSVADETTDMQRVNTVLTRQFLDNLYWVNNPMTFTEEGSVINMDMLKAPKFGGNIILKKGAVLPPTPLPIPFIGDKALMGLEHFAQVIEKRTGVSRSTMALDPETLQNQSATANQNQKDASYSQTELIARNQAELGWRRVFKMILRLVVKHQDRPRTIRLRDQWVDMDPRYWNSEMDVTINVGLGTGSRDRDMSMLNNILQTQTGIAMQLAQGGFKDKAVAMVPKIIKTATKLAESAGIKNPDEYYPQITDEDVQEMIQRPQPPDPKVEMEKAKLEADMQRGQAEMQMDAQKAQMETELQREKMQADIILQREKMAGELQLKREQLIAEMQLKSQQLAAELQLKERLSQQEMQMKREQGFYQADTNAEVGKYKADATSKVHVGGDPG